MKFSPEMGKAMIAALRAVMDNPPPYSETAGICFALAQNRILTNILWPHACTYGMVRVWSRGWEHHSGKQSYPVPYNMRFYIWEGPNLEMRMKLMQYIIDQITEKVIVPNMSIKLDMSDHPDFVRV